MKKFILLFIITSLLATAYPLNIKLKNVYKTSKEQIKLSDIVASHEGDDAIYQQIQNTVIDNLPYAQRLKNLTSKEVTQKLKSAHPRVSVSIPDNIVAIRWEETFLHSDTIHREAKAFLMRHLSLSKDAEVTLANTPKIPVPNQNVKLTFEENRYSQGSSMVRLDGKVYSQNKLIYVFNVQAKVSEQREVYQAKRSIKKGELVSPEDFLAVRQAINPSGIYLTSLDTTDEYIANNFIGKGALLKKTDITTSPEVRKNDLVTVVVQSDTMQLNYQAISKGNGWLGDRITLQNPESKQDFSAEVIEKNTVLVRF